MENTKNLNMDKLQELTKNLYEEGLSKGKEEGEAILSKAKADAQAIVKKDNEDYFLKLEPSKLYYTGSVETFPSTIALNKLYYFMPYIKGKGVRDLYLIKIVRLGSKAEIHPDLDETKEPRLVFELEFLESLPDYKPIRLNFQHAFSDTFLGRVRE